MASILYRFRSGCTLMVAVCLVCVTWPQTGLAGTPEEDMLSHLNTIDSSTSVLPFINQKVTTANQHLQVIRNNGTALYTLLADVENLIEDDLQSLFLDSLGNSVLIDAVGNSVFKTYTGESYLEMIFESLYGQGDYLLGESLTDVCIDTRSLLETALIDSETGNFYLDTIADELSELESIAAAVEENTRLTQEALYTWTYSLSELTMMNVQALDRIAEQTDEHLTNLENTSDNMSNALDDISSMFRTLIGPQDEETTLIDILNALTVDGDGELSDGIEYILPQGGPDLTGNQHPTVPDPYDNTVPFRNRMPFDYQRYESYRLTRQHPTSGNQSVLKQCPTCQCPVSGPFIEYDDAHDFLKYYWICPRCGHIDAPADIEIDITTPQVDVSGETALDIDLKFSSFNNAFGINLQDYTFTIDSTGTLANAMSGLTTLIGQCFLVLSSIISGQIIWGALKK